MQRRRRLLCRGGEKVLGSIPNGINVEPETISSPFEPTRSVRASEQLERFYQNGETVGYEPKPVIIVIEILACYIPLGPLSSKIFHLFNLV